jgi:hypothetical protein
MIVYRIMRAVNMNNYRRLVKIMNDEGVDIGIRRMI